MSTFEGTSPLVSDRYIITGIAGSAITVGQALQIASTSTGMPPTVNPATAAVSFIVGFALTSQPNVGGPVSIVCRGIIRAISDGTIANAGVQVTVSGSHAGYVGYLAAAPTETGYAAVAIDINNARALIGQALTPQATLGGTVYILVE